MDTSITALTETLKQLFIDLKPNQKQFSFLLLIGKKDHGKSTLLKQSSLEHIEIPTELPLSLYFNHQGIVLEISELWLQQNRLDTLLKHVNKCHYALKITGLLLAIDAKPLFGCSHDALASATQEHAKLLARFSKALGYPLDVAVMFTKLDGIAGFVDFFQQDTRLEENEPFGFSIDWGKKDNKIANNYHARFQHMLEALSQDILPKVHPARSSLKRMLIREFPLQLAKFQGIIHALLKQVSPKQARIRGVYFTSSEQGSVSQDSLNEKICHEYALTLPSLVPQSSNYRAFFINEALAQCQKQFAKPIPKAALQSKHITRIAAGVVGLSLALVLHHFISSTHMLDEVTKELLAYDAEHKLHPEKPDALFHLSEASEKLEAMKLNRFSPPTLQHLKATLKSSTKAKLNHEFIPEVLDTLQMALTAPEQKPSARYEALKTYLALGDVDLRSNRDIVAWFEQAWAKEDNLQNKTRLLKKSILEAKTPLPINPQLVKDTRNYLNAIPAGYLYYALLKTEFPKETETVNFEGFNVGASEIPVFYLRDYYRTLSKAIPEVAGKFQADNWVLERQDLSKLPRLLEETYAYDYQTFWKIFLKDTRPVPTQTYSEARDALDALDNADSFTRLTQFIQKQTSPDLDNPSSVFNQTVASNYTSLSLLNDTALKEFYQNTKELKQFITTLAAVYDDGRTAFQIARARFQNESNKNALSSFHQTAQALPEPVGTWAKQISDDAWYLLMSDAKKHINAQWTSYVYPEYQRAILNRYPFNLKAKEEVALYDFDHFFAKRGSLSNFTEQYVKPFLDTSKPLWPLKQVENHVMPISEDIVQQLVRANVITAMFFPRGHDNSHIDFSLQKMNLDPVIAKLELAIGSTLLKDTQSQDATVDFEWPESDAELSLHSIEGKKYSVSEDGPWAIFKLLDKLNVSMDKDDSSSLHVMFEINGDSGRYVLKTENGLNPFTPGILTEFSLNDSVV